MLRVRRLFFGDRDTQPQQTQQLCWVTFEKDLENVYEEQTGFRRGDHGRLGTAGRAGEMGGHEPEA